MKPNMALLVYGAGGSVAAGRDKAEMDQSALSLFVSVFTRRISLGFLVTGRHKRYRQ